MFHTHRFYKIYYFQFIFFFFFIFIFRPLSFSLSLLLTVMPLLGATLQFIDCDVIHIICDSSKDSSWRGWKRELNGVMMILKWHSEHRKQKNKKKRTEKEKKKYTIKLYRNKIMRLMKQKSVCVTKRNGKLFCHRILRTWFSCHWFIYSRWQLQTNVFFVYINIKHNTRTHTMSQQSLEKRLKNDRSINAK